MGDLSVPQSPLPAPASGSSIRVDECHPAGAAAWDEFLARQPSGSFYHQYAWSQVNSAALGHQSIFLIARRGSEICGIFR